MYTYTLYIYILCVSTSQTKMEGWGEHENITVVGGRQQRLQNGSVEKILLRAAAVLSLTTIEALLRTLEQTPKNEIAERQ